MKPTTIFAILLCLVLFLSGCSRLQTTDSLQTEPIVIDENSQAEIDAQQNSEAKPLNTSDDVDALSADLDATVITEESFN